MKFKFEISIAEIKELGLGPFEFKIALDSMEQNLYDTDTFEIYGEGSFALGILSNDELIGGFRIPMSTLHRVTSQWFPVTSPYTDLISLPENVTGPRVYLSIIEISILSPVQEHREMSEYSIESTPRVFSPNESKHEDFEPKDIYTAQLSQMLDLSRKEIIELRGLLEESKKFIDKTLDDSCKKEDELVKQIKSAHELNSKIESENAKLQAENLRVQIDIQCLRAKLSASIDEIEKFKDLYKDSEGKRKDLQNVLSNAHLKWQELKPNFNAIAALENENQSLLQNLRNLARRVKELEKIKMEDEGVNNMVSTTNVAINQLRLDKEELKKANKQLSEENVYYKELLEKMRGSKSDLELSEASEIVEHKVLQSKTPIRDERLDSIDKALRDYMREVGMQNPFQKVSEGVYIYINKKISLSLKNGVPVIRVGGGYMFIDEFLKIYNGQSKKKPEEDLSERSLSQERKMYKANSEKFSEDMEIENYPDIINTTPLASPMKKKTTISTVAYPTKSAILKKIPRLNNPHRELTPNSRRNRTPRQVFLP
ncbi:hypothetical protein SteCoe_32786 [Stentor coeruleus]|uniref:GAR domain-containing protein n=1 Tax=Stentor coeruleus TaxID=5963 RepID=A0A1R2AY93_9CILI|nr:hypothetical protein SteCoe_32786 [Stentor coeruleus]